MKKVISLLMSLVMAASLIATLPASAESYFTNGSVATAMPIALNTAYDINYGKDTSYGTDFFVKITLPSNGYISVAIKRPVINQAYADMDIEVCNAQGIKITEHNTNPTGVPNINFSTGLKKGTYYVNIKNGFFSSELYNLTSDVIATFAIGFKANNYCEAEPNDGVTTATPMVFGQSYLGFIEPDSSAYDYYKFVVPTARKVRIYIGKYTGIVTPSGTKTYFDLFKSGDEYESDLKYYKGSNDWNSSIYKFNSANNKINVASNGVGYIDKYLTAGTYFIKVSSYLDVNTTYSIGVNNTPAAAVQKPKSNKPAQVTGLKLKKGGTKTAKVAWKKVKGAKGYQVKYSTSKKFKKSKTKTKTAKKNKITLKKLNKKKYYVKVRAYKKVNGKKVYGKYSRTLMLYRMW